MNLKEKNKKFLEEIRESFNILHNKSLQRKYITLGSFMRIRGKIRKHLEELEKEFDKSIKLQPPIQCKFCGTRKIVLRRTIEK